MINSMTFITSDTSASLFALLVLKSALIAALALLVWRLLHKSSASTRHVVLTGALLAIVLLPVIGYLAPRLPLPVTSVPPAVTLTDAGTDVTAVQTQVNTPPPAAIAIPTGTNVPPAAKLRPADALLVLYVCGVAAVLLHLVLGVFRIRRISRRADDVDPGGIWASALEHVTTRRGDARRVRVKTSSQINSPMMWGALAPVILMPDRASEWTESDRRNALLHEMAHVDRGDWLTRILAHVACSFYWFNPLVWTASRLLTTEAEHAADDRVLASGSRPDDYAEQLVSLTRIAKRAEKNPAAGLPMANTSLLGRRVAAVLNTGENRMPLSKIARYALLANITVAAFLIAAVQPVAAHGDSDSRDRTARQARQLTPLHVAVASGDRAEATRLIDAGADVNATMSNSFGPYHRTVLGTAARGGHLELAELLVDEGADVNRKVHGDATALIEALRYRHTELARFLVARGADVNLVARGDGSPLISAAATANTAAVKFLLDQGADPDEWVRGDENPLYHAARSGNVEIVRLLLAAGVDVNQKMRGDGNALIVAIRNGNEEVANALIEAGARGDMGVKGDGNALISAAGHGNLDLLRRMIATGANVNAAVVGDGSPLIVAARNHQLDAAQLLIDNGADINQFVMGDETALIGAAWRGDVQMVTYLLSVGADANYQAATPEGRPRSALGQATRAGHDEVVSILKAAGARE